MNQPVLDKQRKLRCKNPIIILSLVSLVFAILYIIVYFISKYKYFAYSELLFDAISFVVMLVPIVLLILYVFKFFKDGKATIIVPIIFGCLALTYLLSIIRILSNNSYFDWFTLILNLIYIATFVLAILSALKGLNNKVFIIIPTAFSLLTNAVDLIGIIINVIYKTSFDLIFIYLASLIVNSTLNVALLIFGLKNRIPNILNVSPEEEMKIIEKMKPKQALELLKDNLDMGIITEEEYQEQRSNIISNL